MVMMVYNTIYGTNQWYLVPNDLYRKQGGKTMLEFEQYKEKLEQEYKRDLKDILSAYYLTRDLGPSMTAKELGVPRKFIVHYINELGLKELKHQLIRKKAKNFN